jgi:general L-amino acid transport system permease protein
MLSKRLFSMMGDEAWRERERARKRREYLVQAALLLVLAALIASAVMNVSANLEARHIRSGFAFLTSAAGFNVGEPMIAYSQTDPIWKAFLVGILNTIRVSAVSIVAATVLGIIVGLMRLSHHPLLRLLGTAHVEVYRNIPLLVLLLAIYMVVTQLLPGGRAALHIGNWVYLSKAGLQAAVPVWGVWAVLAGLAAGVAAGWLYLRLSRREGLLAKTVAVCIFAAVFVAGWALCGAIGGWEHPQATRFALRGGFQISPEFLTLSLGLTLFTSAAIAEIVRAGVLAVPPDQWNASLALGMTMTQTVNYVVFPQSMKLAIPPLASQYMNLTKNSSLAVLVGYPDLVSVGNTVINVTSQSLEVICIIMAVYLVLNLVISYVMNIFNARVMRSVQ